MSSEADETGSAARGLGGSLCLVAAQCVLALATAGILVVLELLPRGVFADVGGKVLAVGGISPVTVLALGLPARR